MSLFISAPLLRSARPCVEASRGAILHPGRGPMARLGLTIAAADPSVAQSSIQTVPGPAHANAGRTLAPGGSVAIVVGILRLLVRPLGYLAFVFALLALSGAARLLGERHELGFFSGRLARMVWRYPEVTRRGVQMAWVVWLVLVLIAISPLDPIASWWDEVALGAVALAVIWPRIFGGHRAGR